MKTISTITCAAALLATNAIAQGPMERANIVEVATKAGKFKTLLAACKAADLVDTLTGKGPFTVFAPTDEAFAKLGDKAIADLLKPENKDRLAGILTYHVVAGKVPAAKVVGMKSAPSVQGCALPIVVKDGKVAVAGANVVTTDVMASNGIIHIVDTVMLPPSLVDVAASAGSFNTLLAAAKAAGLADTLANGGPFTIFAPTDEAFAKLGKDTIATLLKPENKQKLQAILKHHVVAGKVMSSTAVKLDEAETLNGTLSVDYDAKSKTLKVGGAKVVKADIPASNGVIHVVDSVLLPN